MYLLIFVLIGATFATNCWIDSGRTRAGVCTRRSSCTGSGRAWVKSSTWGRKTAWGCEKEKWFVRCCYTEPSRPAPARPNPSPARVNPSPARVNPSPARVSPSPAVVPQSQSAVTGVKKQLLDLHNNERKCYGVPQMTWSSALELSAKKYAAKCIWGHSSRSERNNAGENLAAGSGSFDALTLSNGWLDEQFNWNCGANRCTRGVCGHYTQMIWASSVTLGCGSVVCHKNSPFSGFGSSWTNVVCHYGPAGNYVGKHPTGASKCGSCARSARSEDSIWAPDDQFQVCVPSSGNEVDENETAPAQKATCACPDSTMGDQPCVPPQQAACTNEAKQCSDGSFVYPSPPDCQAVCPGESSSASTTRAAAVAAMGAGAMLVL